MLKTIENRIKRFRTDHALTQEELAQKAGVSRQTIIAIEKGNYTPSLLLAFRFSKVFKTPIEKLFIVK